MNNINEYGLEIKIIEASTLYEYNIGVRNRYESKRSIFPTSLLLDFLVDNGLRNNGESTRDIICLEFNYGTRSYEEEMLHLKKLLEKTENDTEIPSDIKESKIENINNIIKISKENKDKFKKLTKEELREELYKNGISITYENKNRNGVIKNVETIHYKMLYRSTGKAKKGSCMFIRDKLYKRTKTFLHMGKQDLLKDKPMIVECMSYVPLIASSIVGRIKINPKEILILKDIDSFFTRDIISVETDEEKHCKAIKKFDYTLKNTIFDGQGLIDSSIFPKWGNGYILLRQHFCKFASFCANIQEFFKDYFGDEYETATVKDMFGNEHFVKNIKVITTDNAMKWIKFPVTYEEWCKAVNNCNNNFGIVKTAHESKLGNYQRMSYQMVNSLSLKGMKSVMKDSKDYIMRLKEDKDFFLEYLDKNKNFSNDFEVLVELCKWNKDFHRTDYFKDRKRVIIDNYIRQLKTGKLVQNAENLVIVGSPYAMLLYGATGNPDIIKEDKTLVKEKGTIQCYTERFDFDERLAFFRSPFNSKNNLTYLHNANSDLIKKYFKLGRCVVAVNMIETDFQDRNNGSDQDSDSGYTTNQKYIVEHAKKCYYEYPTIVNNIPKQSKVYRDCMEDYALIDNGLANSALAIGTSSNLAQIAQTYSYNFDDEKYDNYACILAVIAQVAIDSAKRSFDIDVNEEIDRLRKDMDIEENGLPYFWATIRRDGVNVKKINRHLDCPMNRLEELNFPYASNRNKKIKMEDILIPHELDLNRKKAKKVEEFIEKYAKQLSIFNRTQNFVLNNNDLYVLLVVDFERLVEDLRELTISKSNCGLFYYLIDRAFRIDTRTKNKAKRGTLDSKLNKNKSILMSILWKLNPDALLMCFKQSDEEESVIDVEEE